MRRFGLAASAKKSFENVDDGRRTHGRRLDYHTISSPCEPSVSGELKYENIHKAQTAQNVKHQDEPSQKNRPGTIRNIKLLSGYIDFAGHGTLTHPQLLQWFTTFSYLFGSN